MPPHPPGLLRAEHSARGGSVLCAALGTGVALGKMVPQANACFGASGHRGIPEIPPSLDPAASSKCRMCSEKGA